MNNIPTQKEIVQDGQKFTLYLTCLHPVPGYTMLKKNGCEHRVRRTLEAHDWKNHGVRVGNFNRPYAQIEDRECLTCPIGIKLREKTLPRRPSKPERIE